VKGVELEPTTGIEVTDCDPCTCEIGQGSGAATAPQFEGIHCQLLAAFDSDLQRVIDAWGTLPTAIKMAMMALVELT
jgi:hypothetical protein